MTFPVIVGGWVVHVYVRLLQCVVFQACSVSLQFYGSETTVALQNWKSGRCKSSWKWWPASTYLWEVQEESRDFGESHWGLREIPKSGQWDLWITSTGLSVVTSSFSTPLPEDITAALTPLDFMLRTWSIMSDTRGDTTKTKLPTPMHRPQVTRICVWKPADWRIVTQRRVQLSAHARARA